MNTRDLVKILQANPDISLANGDLYRQDNTIMPATEYAITKLSEHDMQAAIIAECDRRALANPDWGTVFAIANGGHRHPAVAAKLKAEGVRRGVPDLCCPVARHSRHALWLELKVGKNTLSPDQEEWIRLLRVCGHCVEVVRDDPQKAIEVIAWYLEG